MGDADGCDGCVDGIEVGWDGECVGWALGLLIGIRIGCDEG